MFEKMLAILVGFTYTGKDRLPYAYRDLTRMAGRVSSLGYSVVTLSDFRAEGENYLFQSLSETIFILRQLISQQKRLIFYYSGHGKDRSLVLPSKEKLSCSTLTRLFRLADPEARIAAFFDCCYGVDLDLCFTLNKGLMRLNLGATFLLPAILSIVDTKEDTRATMEDEGSAFTSKLIATKEIWVDRVRLACLPFVTIKSSFPDLEFVWK